MQDMNLTSWARNLSPLNHHTLWKIIKSKSINDLEIRISNKRLNIAWCLAIKTDSKIIIKLHFSSWKERKWKKNGYQKIWPRILWNRKRTQYCFDVRWEIPYCCIFIGSCFSPVNHYSFKYGANDSQTWIKIQKVVFCIWRFKFTCCCLIAWIWSVLYVKVIHECPLIQMALNC